MHAVLDLQADGADTQNHQALKQRLGQPCTRRLLAHHHRTQLAVVPNQDQLSHTHMQGSDVTNTHTQGLAVKSTLGPAGSGPQPGSAVTHTYTHTEGSAVISTLGPAGSGHYPGSAVTNTHTHTGVSW